MQRWPVPNLDDMDTTHSALAQLGADILMSAESAYVKTFEALAEMTNSNILRTALQNWSPNNDPI